MTTTTDLKALVEAVGGDRVVVQAIARGDQDPHVVEPRPGHIGALQAADLFIRIGLDHEPWVRRLLERAANPRIAPGAAGHLDASRGIALLETATPRVGQPAGHVHAFGNTHYWLDPENGLVMARAIADALSRLAPAHAATFATNEARFGSLLREGLARWRETLEPFRGARVVAYHDTWPYVARQFGFRVVAFIEPSPEVPPSPAYLGSLVNRMKNRAVRAILVEPYVNQGTAQFVADRTGASLIRLIPSVGGDPEAKDYLSLFERNVRALAAGLHAAGAKP